MAENTTATQERADGAHEAATAEEKRAYGEVDLWNGNAAGKLSPEQAAADKKSATEQEATEPDKSPMPPPEQVDGPTVFADFTLEEGVAPDVALIQEFKELAGDMNLSQEQAQQLVDLQNKAVKAQKDNFNNTRQNWLNAIHNDAEFGGNNIGKTTDEALLALQEHDPSGALHKLLIESGFQDNPEVLRFLARVGRRRRTEGRVLTSRSPVIEEEVPLAKRLWPYMK